MLAKRRSEKSERLFCFYKIILFFAAYRDKATGKGFCRFSSERFYHRHFSGHPLSNDFPADLSENPLLPEFDHQACLYWRRCDGASPDSRPGRSLPAASQDRIKDPLLQRGLPTPDICQRCCHTFVRLLKSRCHGQPQQSPT